MYTTTLPNPSNDITPRGFKDMHNENGYSNDHSTNHEGSSKPTILPQQRLQHVHNSLPSFQTLPTDFQKIFLTCYDMKRTCSDMVKLYGPEDPNLTKLMSQISQLESLLLGGDSNIQTTSIPPPSNHSTHTISYSQTSPSPQSQSSTVSTSLPATATVVNITNYQYSQQMNPGVGVPLNSGSDSQNQFGHSSAATAIPVGSAAPLPYGYRQNNSFSSGNNGNAAAVASIVALGMTSSAPPTPPGSYIVEKSEVNLNDSDSDPDSQTSPLGSKKRRTYGQPGFPLIQDKGRGRRQRAKAAPPLIGEDQLYCRACGETQTCEWRRGPDGYKSLCNACGIHYAKIVKKEETAAQEYKPKSVGLSMLLNND